MDLDLPERLQPTRDLLARSLSQHPREQAPAMPPGLARDLAANFAVATAANAPVSSASWTERIRGFFATPGFGLAAAAVVVLGAAVPMLTAPDVATSDTFRGGSERRTNDLVRIAFIGENPKIEAAVKSSGNFEPLAFIGDAGSLPGPKVVINFHKGTITAYDGSGQAVHYSRLPEKPSDVADALADAILRL